ncbi:MAG TPA: c-type cytochrome [Polyangiaceae bacterium]|nr:c-type cytochrome [Polyangiaceae bacterium]
MQTNLFLAIALISLFPLACGGDGPGDSTGSTCPTDSTLTYANFGEAFFQSNCLSCHRAGGPEKPTLSTLDQIRANSDVIDRSAAAGPKAVNTYMPDGGSVAESERRKLGEWLACGAPQ